MIVNKLSLASNGLLSNNRQLSLASRYIDTVLVIIPESSGGGGFMWGRDEVKRQNDDERVIMLTIKAFLQEID